MPIENNAAEQQDTATGKMPVTTFDTRQAKPGLV